MTVPDEAVEAAAEYLPHAGDCEVRPEPECTCWQLRVNLMREALAAAAPFIAAEACGEGHSSGFYNAHQATNYLSNLPVGIEHAKHANPYRSSDD